MLLKPNSYTTLIDLIHHVFRARQNRQKYPKSLMTNPVTSPLAVVQLCQRTSKLYHHPLHTPPASPKSCLATSLLERADRSRARLMSRPAVTLLREKGRDLCPREIAMKVQPEMGHTRLLRTRLLLPTLLLCRS